ncbi:unnamed protein product, partial [Mesorhabditis belari]|uniref:Uncharacterized protein n=1 Tax=Mesorhabditis belari TaxID=2138241 RepID=A0AAF3EI45_9BILA
MAFFLLRGRLNPLRYLSIRSLAIKRKEDLNSVRLLKSKKAASKIDHIVPRISVKKALFAEQLSLANDFDSMFFF